MMGNPSRAALLIVLITTISFCDDKQARRSDVERARLASDIRAVNAPGFRLKATCSFVGEKLETLGGTYVEWWVSKTQWRRETAVGDSRRIEIVGPDKRW